LGIYHFANKARGVGALKFLFTHFDITDILWIHNLDLTENSISAFSMKQFLFNMLVPKWYIKLHWKKEFLEILK
jgi:hypothetical protein